MGSSQPTFQAWEESLVMSMGLLLVANGQATLFGPENYQQSFKEKRSFEFSWQTLGFQQTNAFQMLFFLMPNASLHEPEAPCHSSQARCEMTFANSLWSGLSELKTRLPILSSSLQGDISRQTYD